MMTQPEARGSSICSKSPMNTKARFKFGPGKARCDTEWTRRWAGPLRFPEYPDRYVMVENLNEYTRENLSKALESMGLAMIERAKGKVRLIGKFHQTDHDTFAAILKGGEPVTANELKDQLEINLNAMNERL